MKVKPETIIIVFQSCLYVFGGLMEILYDVQSLKDDFFLFTKLKIGSVSLAIVLKMFCLIKWRKLTFMKFMELQKVFMVPYTILGVFCYFSVYGSLSLGEISQYSSERWISLLVSDCLLVIACSFLANPRFIRGVQFYSYVLVNVATTFNIVQVISNNMQVSNAEHNQGKLLYFFQIDNGDIPTDQDHQIAEASFKDFSIAMAAYIIAYKLVIIDFLGQSYDKARQRIQRKAAKKAKELQSKGKYTNEGQSQNKNVFSDDKNQPEKSSNEKIKLPEGSIRLQCFFEYGFSCCFALSNLLVFAVSIVTSYDDDLEQQLHLISENTQFILSKIIPNILIVMGLLVKITTIIKPHLINNREQYKQGVSNERNSGVHGQIKSVERKQQQNSRPLFTWKQFFVGQYGFIVPYIVMAILCWVQYQAYQLHENYQTDNLHSSSSLGLSILLIILNHFSVSLVNSRKTLSKFEYYVLSTILFIGNMVNTFLILRVIYNYNKYIDDMRFDTWIAFRFYFLDSESYHYLISLSTGYTDIKDLEMFSIATSIAGLLIMLDFLTRRKEEIEEIHNNYKRKKLAEEERLKIEVELSELINTRNRMRQASAPLSTPPINAQFSDAQQKQELKSNFLNNVQI